MDIITSPKLNSSKPLTRSRKRSLSNISDNDLLRDDSSNQINNLSMSPILNNLSKSPILNNLKSPILNNLKSPILRPRKKIITDDDFDNISTDDSAYDSIDDFKLDHEPKSYSNKNRVLDKSSKAKNDFYSKCDIYNLPFNLDEEDFDIKSNLQPIYNQRYDNIKQNLISKHIDLSTIIGLGNISESERTILIEKYSIMNNSKNDLNLYINIQNELNDMIKYYLTIDYKTRLINDDKKKLLENVCLNKSDLENQILNMFDNNCSSQQLYIQGIIYQKYKKLSSMNPTDSEYYKLKEWIEIAIRIPFKLKKNPSDTINQILIKTKQALDKELFGMTKVKEELLMAINQRYINPLYSDTSIALVGPPGVGKTKIISVLAQILDYPYEHISMGGSNDSSFLAGHSYTYEGAKTGKIVDSLIKMSCINGILFFDEIDKIANTPNGCEVSNQLLHITDFTQNDHFCDKYIPEIPIDLSKIWFIFSLNSITNIDPILSNRFNFIHVDGYSIEEKIIICKKHLLPIAYLKYKLNPNKYIFNDQHIKIIVKHSISKEESNQSNINLDLKTGIRETKRSIDHIFDRLSLMDNIVNFDGPKSNSSNRSNSNDNLINLSFGNISNFNELKITEDLINRLLI
jgi:ATP-dependent Lon protease